MKKLFLIFSLILICITSAFGSGFAYAQSSYEIGNFVATDFNITSQSIEQTLLDFVYGEQAVENQVFDDSGLRVDRTAGSDKEKESAEYLYTKLKTILSALDSSIEDEKAQLEDESVDRSVINEILTQSFKFSNGLNSYTSQNVVGLLKSTKVHTNKFVIVGAHYDNYYNYATDMFSNTATKSHGVYDNASGVSAVLEIAKIMQQNKDNIDYNIMFVFYGAEEMGMCGSQYFYQTIAQKDNILLSINLDSIGVGDKMYMYADEVDTLHQDYFKAIADNIYNQDKLTNVYYNLPPQNKKINYVSKVGGLGYSHMGLASDNVTYVSNGVNSIAFFSGNWEDTSKLGIVESTQHNNFNHTKNDSYVSINELYGEKFYNRIASVTNLVLNGLLKEDFSQVMLESAKRSNTHLFFLNPTWAKIIIITIIVISYGAFILIIRKHKPTINPNLEKLKQAVIDNNLDGYKDNSDLQ